MMNRKTEILQHWASKLALSVDLWDVPGTYFIRNSNVVASNRVIAYRTKTTTIVLLPTLLDEQVAQQIEVQLPSVIAGGDLPNDLPLRRRWRDFIYYRDTPILTPVQTDGIRRVQPTAAECLTHLKSACSERDIQFAQITIEDPMIAGYFMADQLIGTASLLYEADGAIADVGVLVHPAHRGQGIAMALVQCLTNWGLAEGRIIQYMSAESNHGSVRTAEKSGFALFFIEDGFELLRQVHTLAD